MVVWTCVELCETHMGLAKYWSCFRSSLWVLHHERHQCREHTIAEPLSDWGNVCILNSWHRHWDAIQISQAMTSTLLGKEAETCLCMAFGWTSWNLVRSTGKFWELQVWTAPGWVIYPELKLTAVSTANPGYGLSDAQKRHIEKCQKANSKLYDNRLMISWKPFWNFNYCGAGTPTSPSCCKRWQRLDMAGSTLELSKLKASLEKIGGVL